MGIRILSVFLLFLFSESIYGQDRNGDYFLLGLGFTVQNSQQDGLNYVINNYNATRQGKVISDSITQASALKHLGKINTLTGFNAYFALRNKKIFDGEVLVEFILGHVSGKSNSEVQANGQLSRRDLKLGLSNFSNTISYLFLQESLIDMGIGGGYNILYFNTTTRRDNDSYESAASGITGGLSFVGLLNFYPGKNSRLCLSLRPYYNLALFDADFSKLNKTINPGSYQYDDAAIQKGKFKNIGLSLNICFRINKNNNLK